jgi:hypothetical protein
VEDENLAYVNGYDDKTIVAGAGTVGVEICEEVPNLDMVIVPVGGCGLIAGMSCAIKTLTPNVRVYGVETQAAASFTAALAAGEPTRFEVESTLADGLAVPVVGAQAFEVARAYVTPPTPRASRRRRADDPPCLGSFRPPAAPPPLPHSLVPPARRYVDETFLATERDCALSLLRIKEHE